MQRRLVAAAAVLAACGLGAASAQARTDNRSKTVYFIHGYQNGSNSNCNMWTDMTGKFRDWGHSGTFYKMAYYHNDSYCNSNIDHHGSHSTHYASGHVDGSHSEDTDIRHLGYHLAWHIYYHHTWVGDYVDVVAHSMGGLITRYAIAQVQRGHSSFPPSIKVEDAVTLGTPHGGARFASACLINCNTQIQQMKMGSSFLVWLQNYAWNPQGYGGTDWSTMGSDDDNAVAADRAAATDSDRNPIDKYMGSCHKTWYTGANDIEHSDFLHDVQTTSTADAYVRHCSGGFTFYSGAMWPVRRSDYAVTYGSH